MLNIICKKVSSLSLPLECILKKAFSIPDIIPHFYIHTYLQQDKKETGRRVEYSSLHGQHIGEQSNITKDCHSAMVGPNTCRGGDFANLFNQMERNKQSLSNHVEKCIKADSLSSFSSSSILRPCFLKYLYLWTQSLTRLLTLTGFISPVRL